MSGNETLMAMAFGTVLIIAIGSQVALVRAKSKSDNDMTALLENFSGVTKQVLDLAENQLAAHAKALEPVNRVATFVDMLIDNDMVVGFSPPIVEMVETVAETVEDLTDGVVESE